jgi:hypothetical protein
LRESDLESAATKNGAFCSCLADGPRSYLREIE